MNMRTRTQRERLDAAQLVFRGILERGRRALEIASEGDDEKSSQAHAALERARDEIEKGIKE